MHGRTQQQKQTPGSKSGKKTQNHMKGGEIDTRGIWDALGSVQILGEHLFGSVNSK